MTTPTHRSLTALPRRGAGLLRPISATNFLQLLPSMPKQKRAALTTAARLARRDWQVDAAGDIIQNSDARADFRGAVHWGKT
jgi:hypothetical protein